MKKLMTLTLAALMLCSLVACNNDADQQDPNPTDPAAVVTDVPTDEPVNDPANNDDPADVDDPADPTEAPEDTRVPAQRPDNNTIGSALASDFRAMMTANPEASAQEIADHLLQNEVIQFSGTTMAVEAGYLTGFDEVEITGFNEGVMFAPMIGSIPFVGYIFTLDADADADAFVQLLNDNANPRWNICVEADETIVEYVGSTVFFLMAPKQIEG